MCDLKNEYDGDNLRVVRKINHGVKVGAGLGRDRRGVEVIGCCTIL